MRTYLFSLQLKAYSSLLQHFLALLGSPLFGIETIYIGRYFYSNNGYTKHRIIHTVGSFSNYDSIVVVNYDRVVGIRFFRLRLYCRSKL